MESFLDMRLIMVFAIIIMAGIAGGTVSYLLAKPERMELSSWSMNVVIGTGAAFLIPLFLRTISSNILVDLFENTGNYEDYFVFFGFCLLASISSRAFIQTLSDKVLKEAEEAKREAKEAKNGVADLVDSWSEQEGQNAYEQSTLAEQDLEIINILLSNPKFKYRSLSGITNEVQQTKDQVRASLDSLVDRGLVSKTESAKGVRWSTTGAGASVAIDNAALLESDRLSETIETDNIVSSSNSPD